MNVARNLFSPFLLFIVLFSSCGKDDSDGSSGTPGLSDWECPEEGIPVFVEDSGMIKVNAEMADISATDWIFRTDIPNHEGQGFLVWDGQNSMGNPGNGLLTYKIRVNTPGTYRFIWRSAITIGNNNTEHNDSWLRIPDAAHFYGMKNNGHIVYPKETELPPIPESAHQSNTTPNGAGADGWFKVYMNNANGWRWQSRTSDHDAHDIYAVFTHPGIYTVEISGRSQGHGIDAFVLFNESRSQNEVTDSEEPFTSVGCL